MGKPEDVNHSNLLSELDPRSRDAAKYWQQLVVAKSGSQHERPMCTKLCFPINTSVQYMLMFETARKGANEICKGSTDCS